MAKGKSSFDAFEIAPSSAPRKAKTEGGKPKPSRSLKSVSFDDDLRKPLKLAAINEGRSESSIINELLRGYLADKGYIVG